MGFRTNKICSIFLLTKSAGHGIMEISPQSEGLRRVQVFIFERAAFLFML
jgi:hypothetical protein